MAADLIARALASLEGVDTLGAASTRLRGAAGSPDADPIWGIIVALDYDYVDLRKKERRAQWGPFAPMMESSDRLYPPRLANVAPETRSLWASIADSIAHPAIKSRLNDLLWECRFQPRPDERARAAIDAYLELSAIEAWRPRKRAEGLVRAIELASRLNDQSRITACIEQIRQTATAWLSPEAPHPPGESLQLLEALAGLPAAKQPPELPNLIATARSNYADNPWILGPLADLEAMIASSSEHVAVIRRQQIETWFTQAAKEDSGLKRGIFLQRAAELSRLHGHSDLRERARRELQAIDVQSELKPISVKVAIPTKEIEAVIERLLEPDDWRECLVRFGIYGPPSGAFEHNQADVKAKTRDHPLLALLPRRTLGTYGVPIRTATSEDEKHDAELIERELFNIQFFANVIALRFLDELRKRKGAFCHDELTQFFTTALISTERADRFARAFALYWEGQADEAAHVILPRLEAGIRELCRISGKSVVREPIDAKPGGVQPLGYLVETLKDLLPDEQWVSWWRYIKNALVEPVGLNLRNRIAHGLVDKVPPQDAAILLHLACYLRLFKLAGDATDQGAGP